MEELLSPSTIGFLDAHGLEVGVGQARMSAQAQRVHARLLELSLEADGEVEVGKFRLAVCLPLVVLAYQVRIVRVNSPASVMGHAGDSDDACSVGTQQRGHQQGCERPVTEVVDTELPLESVLGFLPGDAHDSGVVDENVDLAVAVGNGFGRLANRGL